MEDVAVSEDVPKAFPRRSRRSRNVSESRSVPFRERGPRERLASGTTPNRERLNGNVFDARGTVQLRTADNQRAVNVRGGSRDPKRGGWCTSKEHALALGRFDLDAFSNLRSHIIADTSCCPENGDDGFGDGTPGSYYTVAGGLQRASSTTRTFIQPPYSIVLRVLRHYMQTRWTALLRFDPRTEWFDMIYNASELVCVLRKCEFEPPPGVPKKNGGNSFPHAIYYRNAADVTPEILAMSIAWRKRART